MSYNNKTPKKPYRKRCRKCGYKWYSRVKSPKQCPHCTRKDWKTPIKTGKNHPNWEKMYEKAKKAAEKRKKDKIDAVPEGARFLYGELVKAGHGNTIRKITLAKFMEEYPYINWGMMIAELIEDNRGVEDFNAFEWLVNRTRRAK